MNNSFSLQQIQKTSNLDANLISRQYKLNLMADFMRLKYENPRMKQSQIANEIGLSTSTLQRYRNDINMLSPYRTNPNNTNKRSEKVKNTNFDENLHHEAEVKRPRRTSNNLKTTQTKSNKKNKKYLNGGSIQENFELNDHYLDEIHQNNIS